MASSFARFAAARSKRAMSVRGSILRGTALLTVGQGASRVLALARNVIVARVISPDDFGIAATFTIAITFLEMLSQLAMDTLITQAPDGEDPRLQGTAQLLSSLRGFGIGLSLLVLAWPLADLFGVPQARWAFQVIAVVPAVRGLTHLDVHRLQRVMDFVPVVLVDLVPQLVMVLAAWPLSQWLGDYSAVLWLILANAVLATLVSHLLAKRRYCWCYDRVAVRKLAKFGWPLLINGVLLFGVLEGERVALGTAYTMEELAIYTVALTVTSEPTLLIARIMRSALLPPMSAAQDAPIQFRRRAVMAVEFAAFVACMLALPLIMAGSILTPLLYGSDYERVVEVLPWLAAAQGVRLLRVSGTVALLSQADTIALLLANVARSLALLAVAVVALTRVSFTWMAIAALLGEVLAVLATFWRLHATHGVKASSATLPMAALGACIAGAIALHAAAREGAASTQLSLGIGVTAAAGALMLRVFPEARRVAFDACRKARGRLEW